MANLIRMLFGVPPSVVLFPSTLCSESRPQREVQYEFWRPDDGDPPQDRLNYAAPIYEQLALTGPLPQCFVQYLGRINTCYRVERFEPGPMPYVLPKAEEADRILALYQRWALQSLAALNFMHDRGIILNAVDSSSLWLRNDLSIAIANLVDAGSVQLGIEAGIQGCNTIDSPWRHHPISLNNTAGGIYAGHVKVDLFDWATMVYAWFSHGRSPLDYDIHALQGQQNTEYEYRLLLERQNLVSLLQYHQWPILDDSILGPILLGAWQGQYENTAAALQDTRAMLQSCGRRLAPGTEGDIVGFGWPDAFEFVKDNHGRNAKLRLRAG
ncbi:hypothetical protein LTR78_010241 [Recurvomyces mirabilis]|uniref:Protein kinase domain-containing protein n=1 Tax=Recurvomyces mirabilis TaxID=574656 RepID=A0AAE0TN46_9PEZI|nr:hypothetical protein LTR78_010241 [Recurvomyces mirabilis]KAK5156414.1 hypothetical protein LTS14_005302 [Recurvomyces mirabilis]